MENRKSHPVFFWIARIYGTIILILTGAFVVAVLFGSNDESGAGFQSAQEIIMFACFPVLALLGLIVGFFKQRIGGIITTAAMIILYGFELSNIANPYFGLVTLAGLLYLTSSFIKARPAKELA